MKLKASQIEPFIRSPDSKIRAILIYGPDLGLIGQRSKQLLKFFGLEPGDPFRLSEINGPSLKEEQSLIYDEAMAIPFGGGVKIVLINDPPESSVKAFDYFLDKASENSGIVLVKSGDLGPNSALRKLFEQHPKAAALPCYTDEGKNLGDVIRDILAKQQITARGEVFDYITLHLGNDRAITVSELEKLALYKGGPGEISLEEAQAILGDNAAFSIEALAFATASGNMLTLSRDVNRLLKEGESEIAILRGVARLFQRIWQVKGAMEQGQSLEKALEALKPKVIFKWEPLFKSLCQKWNIDRLGRTLERLTQAEIDCKSTGLPGKLICERTLWEIATWARKAS